jgi:hypothetical protein
MNQAALQREWRPGTPMARAYFAIRAAGAAGMCTNALHAIAGGSMRQLHDRLGALQREALVAGPGPAGPWTALTPEAPPAVAARLGHMPACDDLAERAYALVSLHPAGCDTALLAAELGSTPEEVRAALEASPLRAELTACKLLRQGAELALYRLSARGVAAYRWADSRLVTWENHKARLGQAFGSEVAVIGGAA